MPIIKHISAIHTAPKKFVDYIGDKNKTDGAKYVTGINVPEDKDKALKCMKRLYEQYAKQPFYTVPSYSLNETRKQKESIRLHHYVQSFSPDEKLSPEEAHQIGLEWAEKVFGNQYQVLVTTHIDKGHIHNHFAVSAFSLDGKHWNDNQKTLNKCKRISDQISREHGLSIIEPKHKNTMKYYEWLAREKGVSIKQKIQLKMDELILDENVRSVEDLAERLRETGCNVRLGKYMTVQPPNSKRAYRTDNLDKNFGGYSISELQYRIVNKDKEYSDEAIRQFSGIQKKYAVYIRSIQISIYRKESKKVSYGDLLKSTELLNYLCENNIHSVNDLRNIVDEADERYHEKRKITDSLKKRIAYLSENESRENNPFLEKAQTELSDAVEELKILYNERKKAGDIYRTYLEHTGDKPEEESSSSAKREERENLESIKTKNHQERKSL